jgi:hypothetical protein
MQNPWNPTIADIREWASAPDTFCPVQDWDLVITGLGFEGLFLELVEDPQCLKADFFLHCLYLWVYDTVRVHGCTSELESALQRGGASSEPALRQWARRSRALIADPGRAGQHLWWGFGQKRNDAN